MDPSRSMYYPWWNNHNNTGGNNWYMDPQKVGGMNPQQPPPAHNMPTPTQQHQMAPSHVPPMAQPMPPRPMQHAGGYPMPPRLAHIPNPLGPSLPKQQVPPTTIPHRVENMPQRPPMNMTTLQNKPPAVAVPGRPDMNSQCHLENRPAAIPPSSVTVTQVSKPQEIPSQLPVPAVTKVNDMPSAPLALPKYEEPSKPTAPVPAPVTVSSAVVAPPPASARLPEVMMNKPHNTVTIVPVVEEQKPVPIANLSVAVSESVAPAPVVKPVQVPAPVTPRPPMPDLLQQAVAASQISPISGQVSEAQMHAVAVPPPIVSVNAHVNRPIINAEVHAPPTMVAVHNAHIPAVVSESPKKEVPNQAVPIPTSVAQQKPRQAPIPKPTLSTAPSVTTAVKSAEATKVENETMRPGPPSVNGTAPMSETSTPIAQISTTPSKTPARGRGRPPATAKSPVVPKPPLASSNEEQPTTSELKKSSDESSNLQSLKIDTDDAKVVKSDTVSPRQQRAARRKHEGPVPDADSDRRSKRSRQPAMLYQSPYVEGVTRVRKMEVSSTPKTPQEKLILFFKNEHIAVRNAEGTFYLCQVCQNVFKETRKIKIRWLSPELPENKDCDTYKADYYDVTDFDCILTSVDLEHVGRNQMRLSKEEETRINNILQRAFDREKGVVKEMDTVAADHPDGLDLSLYTDEAQIQKEQKNRRRTKRRHTNDSSDEDSEEDEDDEDYNQEEDDDDEDDKKGKNVAVEKRKTEEGIEAGKMKEAEDKAVKKEEEKAKKVAEKLKKEEGMKAKKEEERARKEEEKAKKLEEQKAKSDKLAPPKKTVKVHIEPTAKVARTPARRTARGAPAVTTPTAATSEITPVNAVKEKPAVSASKTAKESKPVTASPADKSAISRARAGRNPYVAATEKPVVTPTRRSTRK